MVTGAASDQQSIAMPPRPPCLPVLRQRTS